MNTLLQCWTRNFFSTFPILGIIIGIFFFRLLIFHFWFLNKPNRFFYVNTTNLFLDCVNCRDRWWRSLNVPHNLPLWYRRPGYSKWKSHKNYRKNYAWNKEKINFRFSIDMLTELLSYPCWMRKKNILLWILCGYRTKQQLVIAFWSFCWLMTFDLCGDHCFKYQKQIFVC